MSVVLKICGECGGQSMRSTYIPRGLVGDPIGPVEEHTGIVDDFLPWRRVVFT